jgi:hypothetical protein
VLFSILAGCTLWEQGKSAYRGLQLATFFRFAHYAKTKKELDLFESNVTKPIVPTK